MRIKNYINGSLVESKEYIQAFQPATGQAYYQLPNATLTDLEQSVEGAKTAQKEWASWSVEKRCKLLLKLADNIEENIQAFADAESKDVGKTYKTALNMDIKGAIRYIRFYANAPLHHTSECHEQQNFALSYTQRMPVGIVGIILPWNFPLYLCMAKCIPALIMGNAVIVKPSELTSYTTYLFAQEFSKLPFPKGILQILFGTGEHIGENIVKHPDIRAISFTGSVDTGKKIAVHTAQHLKKISLELGGKNPTIIFEDCPFEKTIKVVVESAFSNQGEVCLAGSKIYIQKTIYTKFKTAFCDAVANIVVGDPSAEHTDMGSLVSKEHLEKVLGYIDKAKQDGGKIIQGGNRIFPKGVCAKGYFIEPTVIEGLDDNASVNTEEIFGPVVTLIPFDTTEDIERSLQANRYGLSASIWSKNTSKAMRLATQIEAGMVWINAWAITPTNMPFGGMKHSGIGREGGKYSLNFFSEEKNITIKI